MTLNDFIAKNNGKYLEVAGSADAKFQCVDSVNAYIRDVLGLPIIEWTNAVDFPAKAGSNYDYILNSPTNIPQEGDLVVWKPSPGHIAVFIEGNVDKFKSFDQNFPIDSPCHVQDHTYLNVIGWLHPKVISQMVQVEPATFEELVKKSTAMDSACDKLAIPHNPDLLLPEIDKLITIEDTVVQKDRELTEKAGQISNLAENLANMRNELAGLRIENDKINGILDAKEIQFKDMQEELEKLKTIKPINQYSRLELLTRLIFGNK